MSETYSVGFAAKPDPDDLQLINGLLKRWSAEQTATELTALPTLTVLRLAGDLDLLVAQNVRAAGLACLDGAAAALIIDLADVALLDAAGLSALVHVRNAAVAEGKAVVVIRARPGVHRVFEVTGLSEAFGLPSL